MPDTYVVTYSALNTFAKLSLCDKHAADGRTRYTAHGQPYVNVSMGRHRGTCDECEAERDRYVTQCRPATQWSDAQYRVVDTWDLVAPGEWSDDAEATNREAAQASKDFADSLPSGVRL
jgi:hypothetical protein